MEEPYLSLQNIGVAVQKLSTQTELTPTQQFSEAQLLSRRLFQITSEKYDLTVDWEQYIAGIEMALMHLQAEARSKLD